MPEQAQTSATAATKAPPPKRTRPSRAKSSRPGQQPAHANGALKFETETETVQHGREAQSEGEGADRHTAGREAAVEEAWRREEAVRLEAECQEVAEKEAARVRQLLANYHALMSAASACFDHASSAMAEISATLTWEPENFGTVHLSLQKVERGLTDFRTYLTQALGLGAEQHLRAPSADLGKCLDLAIGANVELRRRVDAQISILSSDVGNTPALLAMSRSITEQLMLSTLMNRGLGRLLVREKIAR